MRISQLLCSIVVVAAGAAAIAQDHPSGLNYEVGPGVIGIVSGGNVVAIMISRPYDGAVFESEELIYISENSNITYENLVDWHNLTAVRFAHSTCNASATQRDDCPVTTAQCQGTPGCVPITDYLAYNLGDIRKHTGGATSVSCDALPAGWTWRSSTHGTYADEDPDRYLRKHLDFVDTDVSNNEVKNMPWEITAPNYTAVTRRVAAGNDPAGFWLQRRDDWVGSQTIEFEYLTFQDGTPPGVNNTGFPYDPNYVCLESYGQNFAAETTPKKAWRGVRDTAWESGVSDLHMQYIAGEAEICTNSPDYNQCN